jgi:hypothetical protein
LNLLDENFPDDQRSLLRAWRIPFREIGGHAGHFGVKDDDILPLLHRQRQVTFFTQDEDFFRRQFCHPAYCLLWLDVRADDAAYYVRRFLRHPRFSTIASRLGVVARARHNGIHFWQRGLNPIQSAPWPAQ